MSVTQADMKQLIYKQIVVNQEDAVNSALTLHVNTEQTVTFFANVWHVER